MQNDSKIKFEIGPDTPRSRERNEEFDRIIDGKDHKYVTDEKTPTIPTSRMLPYDLKERSTESEREESSDEEVIIRVTTPRGKQEQADEHALSDIHETEEETEEEHEETDNDAVVPDFIPFKHTLPLNNEPDVPDTVIESKRLIGFSRYRRGASRMLGWVNPRNYRINRKPCCLLCCLLVVLIGVLIGLICYYKYLE